MAMFVQFSIKPECYLATTIVHAFRILGSGREASLFTTRQWMAASQHPHLFVAVGATDVRKGFEGLDGLGARSANQRQTQPAPSVVLGRSCVLV